jgi:hypothetical protein
MAFNPDDAAALVLAIAEPAAAAHDATVTVWEVVAVPAVLPWQSDEHFVHETTVQIDVRAAGKAAARLASVAVAGAVLAPGRRLVTGPQWLADGDGGARYVLRVAVTSRAV